MAEKIAPVQGYSPGIPWSLHLEAYDAYSKKWSPQPALIDLEGRNCRGGFSTEELDVFVPGWRARARAMTQDAQDAERWRVLCRNFGNETDLATPGKKHDIVIKLNPDGCERYNADGSLDFAATLAAIMDDELRIQARASSSGNAGVAPASSVARERSNGGTK